MMILIRNAVWLLAGIDAALLAVIGGILFSYIRDNKRTTAGIAELVKSIKENEPAQLETLRGALKEQYAQSDEDAAENAKKLVKVKKAFYKHLINAHLGRNSEAFGALDPRLDELLTAYRSLMPVVADEHPQDPQAQSAADEQSAPQSAPADANNFQADLEEIKRQNNELKNELESTKNALHEALNEYVSAYSGSAEAGRERLESELTKLQDKKETGAAEEQAASPAVTPVQPDAEARAEITDKAAGDAAQREAPREQDDDTQRPSAKVDSAGQGQNDIDELMEGMPSLDGILVQEVDDSQDGDEIQKSGDADKDNAKQETSELQS